MSDSALSADSDPRTRPIALRPRSKTESDYEKPHMSLRRGKSASSVLHNETDDGRFMESSEFTSVNEKHFVLEQLVRAPGNLPPPLSEQELSANKEAAYDHSYVSKIPQSLITAPGADGQLLRRGLLSGATIVFFTPGYEGKRFIYERAKELNVSSVIIDSADSWAVKLVEEGVIKKFIPLDMEHESDVVFQSALAAIKALKDDPLVGYPHGICTFSELSVPLVARLCNTLGLPSSSAEAVDIARNKHCTRAAMRDAGLATVANALIKSVDDVDESAAVVGFPAVLKPISGAASLGVKKVYNLEELRAAFVEVTAEMRDTVVSSGALVKTKTIDQDLAAVMQQEGAAVPLVSEAKGPEREFVFMLEEYLDGVEVDVDIVLYDGEAQYCVVVDNGPTIEPYFNETWGLCPSQLDDDKQAELRELGIASLKACKFTQGVFHVELKYTNRGPRLIEINARMGGGQVRATHLRVFHVDLVEETLFGCVGIPNRPHKAEPPLCHLAYNYVNARKSGKVVSTAAVKAIESLPDVVYSKALVREGEYITGPEDGMPTWVADVMVSKPNANEALQYVLKLSETLNVPIAAPVSFKPAREE